jgi:hypothetical protein
MTTPTIHFGMNTSQGKIRLLMNLTNVRHQPRICMMTSSTIIAYGSLMNVCMTRFAIRAHCIKLQGTVTTLTIQLFMLSMKGKISAVVIKIIVFLVKIPRFGAMAFGTIYP